MFTMVRLVGGPYDGTRGLAYEGEDWPAEQITVGRCMGNGCCTWRKPGEAVRSCTAPHVTWQATTPDATLDRSAQYTRIECDLERLTVRYLHAEVDLSSYYEAGVPAEVS